MNFVIKKYFIFIAIFFLISCTTTLDPQNFSTKNSPALNLIGVKTLSIKAKLVGKKSTEMPLPGGSVIVNEDEFTQALVYLVADVFKQNQISIIPTSERVIEIQVVKVTIQPTNTIYCVIDFNRKLGNGEFYGFQSRSKNWNFETACEEALNNAVSDILTDQQTLRYLKGE